MIYYSPDKILQKAEKLDSPAILVAGGKGNGKTYGFILYYLKEFIKTGLYLRYVRRYYASITPKSIASLLKPQKQNIINLTNGEYNSYKYYRNRFYLTRVEDDKIVKTKQEPFIVCSALNSVESFTGADEGECSAIVYDEVLSREKELDNEFSTLMILHSNTIRNRTDHYTPLIMIGNTFTRNSMLLRDFGVDLYKIKPDSVTVFKNNRNETTIVVERCEKTVLQEQAARSYYDRYDDSRINMITSGDWSIGNYPRIQPKYKYGSDVLFSILCVHNVNVALDVMLYKSTLLVYVRRPEKNDEYDVTVTTREIIKGDSIISYLPNDIPVFKTIYKLLTRRQALFEDGETGEMFRDFLNNVNGGKQLGGLYK